MKIQRAVDVKADKTTGYLWTGELQTLLADGWTVVTTAESSAGSILVIVEKEQP